MSATPVLLAEGGNPSASGQTLTLLNSTADGDTIVVGVAVNTSAVVPSVSDTQGNSYSAISVDATLADCQIWTFESVGAAALVAGTDTISITIGAP